MSTQTPNNSKRSGPPGNAAGRRTPTTTNPSPSRMAAPQTSGSSTSTTNGLNRTRSLRNGAPPSARAAAAARKLQTPDPEEEDAKAEMQARLDDLQQKLQQAELACEESRKQATVVQVKLDEALKEQGLLEEHVHEHTERISALENEKKDSLRARREMEQFYESERGAALKEKEELVAREEEMQQAMQRMKETLAQREVRAGLDDERKPILSRHSSGHGRSSNQSPNPDGSDLQFAPPSIQRSDSSSRSNATLVNQKDKIIESLRLELAEAQIKLVEVENMGGGRMQELQKQVYDTKMHNARLMEENESFQLLLQEKTLNGDFLRPPSNVGSRPPSRHPDGHEEGSGGGASLADELESHDESEGGDDSRRLQAEVNSLKDQNKALTLYINNIISRLLQSDQFEQILDKTPDLMAGPGATGRRQQQVDRDKELPPPPSDEQPSLLQRAKSVMGGKKPRPLSQQLTSEHAETSQQHTKLTEPSKHEDPTTAPRVPLGRSSSTRAPGGHRRANSEWHPASVVTNMYKGPQNTTMSGPLSPGLTSPTGARNSFFSRAPSSGSGVPTISESTAEKENSAGPRDSKIANSNRNSVISNPPAGATESVEGAQEGGMSGLGAERSNPSSPPRSTASSGDKDTKQSGAIYAGSKPRPLRLVQEAADEDAAAKKANRGSWFGWMNKGGTPPTGSTGGGLVGRSNSGEPPAQ